MIWFFERASEIAACEVRRTPTHLVALTILGEPVGASLMTWAFFGEQPTAPAALGGAVILTGIGLGFAGRRS